MITVYVVVVMDRHDDPDPRLFSGPITAIQEAKKIAADRARIPSDVTEYPIVGNKFLYYSTWSDDGDGVYVVSRVIDADVTGQSDG